MQATVQVTVQATLVCLAAATAAAQSDPAGFATVITIPGDASPASIGSDTQANLLPGGVLLSNNVFQLDVGAPDGSSTNVELNILGGAAGTFINAWGGAQVNLLGGRVGDVFRAQPGSSITIAGGTLGDGFSARAGSTVEVRGGGFRLNSTDLAVSAAGELVDLPPDFVLSGTLADGTPFAFSDPTDLFFDGRVLLRPAPLPPVGPAVLQVSEVSDLLGLRAGQTALVAPGGLLQDDFNAGAGSRIVLLEGAAAGENLELVAAELTILGGGVGRDFEAFDGALVQMESGDIGLRGALSRSTLNLGGGAVNDGFSADGSVLRVTGGSFAAARQGLLLGGGSVALVAGGAIGTQGVFVGRGFEVAEGSVANISGGEQLTLRVLPDATVNLFGTSFTLDGAPIEGLTPGGTVEIDQRGGALAGVLASGEAFSYGLQSVSSTERFFFDADATLTVTLVQPGDYNGDGVVDGADYAVWRGNLGAETSTPFTPGDGNGDGRVNQADLAIWRQAFGAGAAAVGVLAVPEPRAAGLLAVVGGFAAGRGFRRRNG
ncbi:MAG: dockerin type I domain-containing protein [Planctomycetota bacterium]